MSVSPFFEIAPGTLMGSFNQVANVGDVFFFLFFYLFDTRTSFFPWSLDARHAF